jgi:cysteinyl-tRNA synthetase
MERAVARVGRLRNFFRDHPAQAGGAEVVEDGLGADRYIVERENAFLDALADDFNTPRAMAEVFDLVAEANRRELPGASEALHGMLELLGLGSVAEAEEAADDEAERLLAERQEARAAKDFARADEIRDRLAELGWEVRDSADGARLVRR